VTNQTGPALAELIGIGLASAGCVAVGVGGGYWIGATTGAGDVVTFAGLGVGMVAAVAATYFKIKRYL
jgi:hypothetical protein